MIDRLRQMAIFAKTIDHGSFRGAARDLNLSPSVVSHHISQLEEHLGVALIYRTTRKLTLTGEGEKLLGVTRKMLAAVEGELEGLSASASEPSGELRITLPSVLSQSKVIQQLGDFSAKHPRVQLVLDFSDKRRELIADRLDLAIRVGEGLKASPTSRHLFSIQRKLVASKAYLDGHPPVLEPKHLRQLNWMTLAHVHNKPFALKTAEGTISTVKPNVRLSTNDAQSLYSLVRADTGIALVLDFLVEDDLSAGRMVHLLPEWNVPEVDVFAQWPANAPKHGLIHLALKALQ